MRDLAAGMQTDKMRQVSVIRIDFINFDAPFENMTLNLAFEKLRNACDRLPDAQPLTAKQTSLISDSKETYSV